MGKEQATTVENKLNGALVHGFQLAITELRHGAARTGEPADWMDAWAD